MIVREKSFKDRLYDCQAARNELSHSALQCLTSVREFASELPRFETEFDFLRDADGKGVLNEVSGFTTADELLGFQRKTKEMLANLDEAVEMISRLRPHLGKLVK